MTFGDLPRKPNLLLIVTDQEREEFEAKPRPTASFTIAKTAKPTTVTSHS
jgi:hypothetical protein